MTLVPPKLDAGGDAARQVRQHTREIASWARNLNDAFTAEVSGHLTPEMYGAKGDGTTDDSQAFSAMLSAASSDRRYIRLGPKTYYLNGAAMMPITGNTPLVIAGAGPSLTDILLGTDHRGPVFGFKDTVRTTVPGGAFSLSGFRITGPLLNADDRDTTVPIGVQSGIMFMDRHDHPILRDIIVDGIRVFGISMGRSYGTNVGYVRECTWVNVQVYNCGANKEWPAVEIASLNDASDETNNLWFYGCRFSFNQGPNLRLVSTDGRKSGGTTNLAGLMVHGRTVSTLGYDADCSPTGWDLLEINGELQNVTISQIAFNASQTGQYLLSFDNTFRYDVALPVNAIATTNGSTTVTVTATALPTRTIAAADIVTEQGSNVVTVYWPAHGFSAGNWLTFDNWNGSGGARNTTQYTINGVVFSGEQQVLDVVDTDHFRIMARRGIATVSADATGSTSFGASKILRRTYGIVNGTTAITWGTWSGGVFTNSTITVNGVALTGNRVVTTLGGPNIWTWTASTAATSTGTYASATTVSMFSNMGNPQLINVQGRANSGANGVDVRWGNDLFINLPTPTSGTDLKVSANVRGDVVFNAETRETTYALDVDPTVKHLVSSYISPSMALPYRAAMLGVGTSKQGQSFTYELWCTSTTVTARRVSVNGTQTLSTANAVALPAAGVFAFRIEVSANQTGGSSGTVRDHARWTLYATATWDGTAGAVVVSEVNASAANVGVNMAPSWNVAAAAAWRVNIAADATYDALGISVVGEANKTISWNARIERVDSYS